MKMSKLTKLAMVASIFFASAVLAEEKPLPPQTLFTNVHIWDGISKNLSKSTNVLIENNLIKKVGAADTEANAMATVIDGKGKTLMPGLIESHVHLNLQHMIGGYETMEDRDWQEIGAMSAFAAQSLLMDGYTTVRDCGTLQSGMRRAVDAGFAIGPRIYSAVGVIS
jgi:imidazolonepropionase-like amidohydrolase